MIKYELIDEKITKATIINVDFPNENYKANLHQNLIKVSETDNAKPFSLTFEMFPESEENVDNKSFYILVEATGLYNITAPDDTDPEEVGKLLSKDLFPFLRASVSTIMTSAGIPPYTIPRSILKP